MGYLKGYIVLQIENVIADIKLHDQKIAKRFYVGPGVVKTKGIILEKPFKLQITVVAKLSRQKRKRVRSIKYWGTLREAVDNALQLRRKWATELKVEITAPTKNQSKAITEMLTLTEAFKLYSRAQEIKFKSRDRVYDDYRYQKLFDKHIKPVLGDTLLDDIDSEDIAAISNGMVVTRAKISKDGKKIPKRDKAGEIIRYANGKPAYETEVRPATERTKRTIYQLINPIYTYVNGSNKIKFNVNSPASMKDLPALENEREVTVGVDSFRKLYHHEHPYYQKIFVWLMHGRRFGEVSSLEYSDINIEDGEYTIQKKNNKARVPMTYKLTKWQRDTLPETLPEEGLVFPSLNDSAKKLNTSTVSGHFSLDCTLHDLRHILGNALINRDVGIEKIGRILGHKPSKRIITNRYAKVTPEAANKVLVELLDEVLI